MLEVMDIQLVNSNDILFFEPDKVYVLISGNIVMKNHDAKIELPLTCAKFGEGDILNFM
jgi:archaellum component FlaF (FlaF/FlaG flagellin family)